MLAAAFRLVSLFFVVQKSLSMAYFDNTKPYAFMEYDNRKS